MLPIGPNELSPAGRKLFTEELAILSDRGIRHYLLREAGGGEVLFVPEAGRAGLVWSGGVEWTEAHSLDEIRRRLRDWDFTG